VSGTFGPDARLDMAVAFMRATLARPLTVDDIARQVGYSGSRFSHLFRQKTGMSVGKMLARIRFGARG